MQQQPMNMNIGNMVRASGFAKAYVRDLTARAEEMKKDFRKEARKEASKCRACFYTRRMGGAAMTYRPCMCCGKDQLYGSTATDVLCLECAEKHSLCKQCGGDLEMRTRRKEWPKRDTD